MLQVIIQALPLIKEPHSSTRLRSHALGKYMAQFEDDYFLYAGSINTTTCVHYVLWLISRVPMGVSMAQVCLFAQITQIYNFSLLFQG